MSQQISTSLSLDTHTPETRNLDLYGWSPFFAACFESSSDESSSSSTGVDASRFPARVLLAQRGHYRLASTFGEIDGVLAGRLRHHADGDAELPAVGDWVVGTRPGPDGPALLLKVLPRRTRLSRKVAGARTREQIVAVNVDVVFLVMGLDGDFNPRRLERFLAMTWESGARPVVVLNKADLAVDLAAAQEVIEEVALGVPVATVSAALGEGLGVLDEHLRPAETIALVGSSGVGKSTLINRLCGAERLRTGVTRASDDRGRHTTTHRELVRLAGGALLIDNPGIRELQLWSSEDGLGVAFDDLEELAEHCRFRDCGHGDEPGCAVREAVERGELTEERLANWHKLEREQRFLELRQDVHARREDERRTIALHRAMKNHKKHRRR